MGSPQRNRKVPWSPRPLSPGILRPVFFGFSNPLGYFLSFLKRGALLPTSLPLTYPLHTPFLWDLYSLVPVTDIFLPDRLGPVPSFLWSWFRCHWLGILFSVILKLAVFCLIFYFFILCLFDEDIIYHFFTEKCKPLEVRKVCGLASLKRLSDIEEETRSMNWAWIWIKRINSAMPSTCRALSLGRRPFWRLYSHSC